MGSPDTSTALALLFGLGVGVAGLPASADQVAGQAEGAQEMTTGQQGGGEPGARPATAATGREGTAGATGAGDPEGAFGQIDRDGDGRISRESSGSGGASGASPRPRRGAR